MPRTQRSAVYGPEYEALLHAAIRDQGFTMTLASNQLAAAFRVKVYAYFKAIRTEGQRPDLVAACDRLRLGVKGPVFTITMRADAWDTAALREALDMPREECLMVPDNTASLMAKLDEIRKKAAQ